MMRIFLALSLAVLAGCGVDGEPVRPHANIGVTITPDGIRPSTSVGVTSGPVRVGVSL